MPETEPEFDIVIVGSGIAGALSAYRLAQARPQLRVLMLEAGGVAPDSLGEMMARLGERAKMPFSPASAQAAVITMPIKARIRARCRPSSVTGTFNRSCGIQRWRGIASKAGSATKCSPVRLARGDLPSCPGH